MSEVQPRNALNLWKNAAVAVALEGTDGQARMVGENNPLPVSFAPGATTDPDAAREATLQQVRDGITALAALLGSTDGLETLLSTQATYLDQVESLLSTLGGHTDGLEGLLSALGVKDDATLAKLEEIRVLAAARATEATLASVLTSLNLLARRTDTQPVSAAALPLPTGASTSALQTTGNTVLSNILTAVGLLGTEATQVAIRNALTGILSVKLNPDNSSTTAAVIATGSSIDAGINYGNRTLIAVTFGPGMTATNFYFEHSVDGGVTYNPVYDGFGNAYQYVGASNRTSKLAPTDFARLGLVRLRLGTIGNPVAQTANLSVTYTLAVL